MTELGALYVLEGQSWHLPLAQPYEPAAQALAHAPPGPLHERAGHATHADAASGAENPDGHAKQELEPDEPAALPGAQAAQDAAPTAPAEGCAVPGGQGTHVRPSAVGAYVPDGHSATHWGEPVDARNVPSGQLGTQVVAPATDTNPAAHAGHTVVPVTAEEVPAAHGEQDDDPGGANEPGAHV